MVKKINSASKKRRTYNPYSKIDWEKVSEIFKKSSPVIERNKFPPVKDMLHILAAAGTIGLIFAFPGAAIALGSLTGWRSKKVFYQLEKQKYVTIKENPDNTITVKITKNGMVKALTYELNNMKMILPKKWDHKWRLVIFDIPDKYKKIRDIFRNRLIQLGLYQLQESVYVYPYPCFDEIEFLKELYGVPFTIKYLLVEKIEDDALLRSRFELDID